MVNKELKKLLSLPDKETRKKWRKRYKKAMISAIEEFCPTEFEELLDAVDYLEKQLSKKYRDGIKAAAAFAGEWDNQIIGTEYTFEDIILRKFNIMGRRKMRKKS